MITMKFYEQHDCKQHADATKLRVDAVSWPVATSNLWSYNTLDKQILEKPLTIQHMNRTSKQQASGPETNQLVVQKYASPAR